MEPASIDLESLAQLIESSTTEVNNDRRKELTDQLTKTENDHRFEDYAKAILDLLSNENLIDNQILHLRICTYSKEFFKRKYIESEISDEAFVQIIEILISIMTHERISLNNKNFLYELCQLTFHFLAMGISKKRAPESEGGEDPEPFSISEKFAESILNLISQTGTSKNATIGAILVWKSYLSALKHEKMLNELARVFLPHLIARNNEIMGEILKEIHDMEEADYIDGNEKLERVINCYEVESAFIGLIHNIIKECMIHKGKGCELFIAHTGMANLLFQIIGVVGTKPTQCPQSLISYLENPRLDNLINETKSISLKILNFLIKMCLRLNCETRLMGNNLVYMQYMIITLNWAASKEDWYDYLSSEDHIRSIVVALLENISLCTKSPIYGDLLARTRAKMIAEVIMIFLCSPEKEKDDALDNPNEFLNLAIDVWDKQESETVKSQAAKCLEALCWKVDGCVSFTAMFCIQAIDCYANKNHLSLENRKHYLILHEFYEKDYLRQYSEESIIESSLTSLSIISHLLAPRQDVIASLDNMIKRNLELLIGGEMLVQARLALFYGYFTDILFKDDAAKFNQSIKFLFEAINYPEETKAIGFQACETLTTMIGDKNVIPKIAPLVSFYI